MLEYKVNQEQGELYAEALSCFSISCGTVSEFLSDSLSEDGLSKHNANITQFMMQTKIILDEIEFGVIRDVDNLYHIKHALEYYGDLLDHTKHIFTNMYKSGITQAIVAKDMLISQNLFLIKQHFLTCK